jgi:hypothetical protein
MENKLVEQYARFLDEGDIVSLFEKLSTEFGNLQDAAKECKITRGTVYNWKNLNQEMRLSTKEKILEQSLEKRRLDTMAFLAEKMTNVVSDLIFNLLVTLYKNIFNYADTLEIYRAIDKFEQAKKQYAGILYNRFEYEIADLTENITEYVSEKINDWRPESFYLYDTAALGDIVKEIVSSIIYPFYSESPEEIAIRLRIPVEIIRNATPSIPQNRWIVEPKPYELSGTKAQAMQVGHGIQAFSAPVYSFTSAPKWSNRPQGYFAQINDDVGQIQGDVECFINGSDNVSRPQGRFGVIQGDVVYFVTSGENEGGSVVMASGTSLGKDNKAVILPTLTESK